MFYFQGHSAQSGELSAQALPFAREESDPWAMAFAWFGQALAAIDRGDAVTAAEYAMAACEAAGPRQEFAAGPLLSLGMAALASGEADRALQLVDRSNELNRGAGEIWGLGIGLLAAAGLQIMRQNPGVALAHASEALSFNQELEDPRGIAWSLEVIGGVFAAAGNPDAAARLWGAAARQLERIGLVSPPFLKWIRNARIGVETSLGPESFQSAIAQGGAMSTAQAISFARHHALPK